MQRKFVKTHEIAKILGVRTPTVRNWIINGVIPARKIGGTWFIAIQDAERLINDSPEDDQEMVQD